MDRLGPDRTCYLREERYSLFSHVHERASYHSIAALFLDVGLSVHGLNSEPQKYGLEGYRPLSTQKYISALVL